MKLKKFNSMSSQTLCRLYAIMRVIPIFCLLFLATEASLGQKWAILKSTGISSITFKDNWRESVYFRKESSIIAIPAYAYDDFSTLFIQNPNSFNLFSDSCLGVFSWILGDSAEKLFNKYKVEKVILIESYGINKENDGKELWIVNSKYGSLLRCWQSINVKRTFINSARRLQLLGFKKQGCEI